MTNNDPFDYNPQNSNYRNRLKQGFIIECVKIDEPKMRAYHYLPTLPKELRGQYLFSYIDRCVKLCSTEEGHSHDSLEIDKVGEQQPLGSIYVTHSPEEWWEHNKNELKMGSPLKKETSTKMLHH